MAHLPLRPRLTLGMARIAVLALNLSLWALIAVIGAALTVLVVWLTILFSPTPARAAEIGIASWYGHESGDRTANGERFNPHGISAAHRTLKFGTRVRVTDLKTGRSVVVRINDRGPARWTGRVIDLSRGAAAQLGMIHRGTARVKIQIER